MDQHNTPLGTFIQRGQSNINIHGISQIDNSLVNEWCLVGIYVCQDDAIYAAIGVSMASASVDLQSADFAMFIFMLHVS